MTTDLSRVFMNSMTVRAGKRQTLESQRYLPIQRKSYVAATSLHLARQVIITQSQVQGPKFPKAGTVYTPQRAQMGAGSSCLPISSLEGCRILSWLQLGYPKVPGAGRSLVNKKHQWTQA